MLDILKKRLIELQELTDTTLKVSVELTTEKSPRYKLFVKREDINEWVEIILYDDQLIKLPMKNLIYSLNLYKANLKNIYTKYIIHEKDNVFKIEPVEIVWEDDDYYLPKEWESYYPKKVSKNIYKLYDSYQLAERAVRVEIRSRIKILEEQKAAF